MEVKVCGACGDEKPKTIDFWYERGIGTNIFKNTCKECVKKKLREKYVPHNTKPIPRKGYKICTVCKLELPSTLEFFSQEKRNKDGVTGKCRTCRIKEQQEYRDKNKDNPIYKKKNIENTRKYNKGHKEKVNEYVKKYYELNYKGQIRMKEYKRNHYKENYANNEEFKEHKKRYYEENKEHFQECSRQWCKNNREKCKAASHIYRAKKKQLPHTLTTQQWDKIKDKFDNKCAYCGEEKPLEQEHVVALSKGGEYTLNNIIPSCKSCNCSKGNREFKAWYRGQKYYSKTRESFIIKHLGYKESSQQLRII